MLTRVAFVLLLAVAASGRQLQSAEKAVESSSSSPWKKFCHDLDCPRYEVVSSGDNYEIRDYEAGNWAYTSVDSLLYASGVSTGFKRLFDYISGKNAGNQKIEMTVPVAVEIVPGQGPFCKSKYVTGFFVPFDYQDSPPEPTNPDVAIKRVPGGQVAVLQFGGFVVDDWTISRKANALKKALDKDGVSYNASYVFSVGYDSPTTLTHRHNEVWLKVESDVHMTTKLPISV